MDWEPEIPGQFDTPLRIRRKRSATDAGFSVINTEIQESTIAHQHLIPGQSWFRPITRILATTFRIIHFLYSITAQSTRRIHGTLHAAEHSIRVVEVRQTTSDGQESVKRRATDSGQIRPVARGSQQIARSGNKTGAKITFKKSTRLFSNVTASTNESPVPPPEHSPIALAEDSARLSLEEAKRREALGALIQASFTPRPLPGMVALEEVVADPASVSSIQDMDMADLPTLTSAEKTSSDELDAGTAVEDQQFRTPEAHDLCQTEFQPTPVNSKPEAEVPTTALIGVLRTVQSYPPSWGQSMREVFERPKSASNVPKQVRFSINPLNGLPDEQSVKFYKGSIVGDWAPSSPWAEEQAVGTISPLDRHLDALMDEELPLLPPTLPNRQDPLEHVPNVAGNEFATPSPTVHDQQYLLEHLPDVAGNEIATLSPTPPRAISPQDDVAPQTPSRTLISGTTIRAQCSETLITELAEAHAPVHESTPVETHETFPTYANPYLRVKNTIVSLFKSPTRLGPSVADSPTVYQSIDASIDIVDQAPPHLSSFDETLKIGNEEASVNHGDISASLAAKSMPLKVSPNTTNGPRSHIIDADEKPEGELATIVDKSMSVFPEQSGGIAVTANVTAPSKNEGLSDEIDRLSLSGPRSKLEMSRLMKERRRVLKKEREIARAAEEAAARARAEEADRRARSSRRMPKKKLVQPLSKDWEARLDECMRKGDHAAVTTTASGTEIRRKDLSTVLGEREWLNDEIINAYIDWIVEYANVKAGKNGRTAIPKVIAHSSFFYHNLATKGPLSVARWMKRKRAEGKKLLEVETILVPVNNAAHWTMIVVSPKARTIEYLDSFSGSPVIFIQNIKRWLAAELGDEWHEEEWRSLDTRSAEQLNGYDCGVFAITNAECVAGGVDTNSYGGGDMAAQRRRIAGVLLNRGFGGEFIPAEEL